jgi:hypothetical protein
LGDELKRFIKKCLLPLLPYGIWKFLQTYRLAEILRYLKHKGVLSKNIRLKNYALGEQSRCFILCNGPSVKQQNLVPLKNEMVISVASGYLHGQFSAINPKFHCVPQITYGVMTEADVVAWFSEMDEHLGEAKLILSDTEYALVQRYQLFKNREVYYLNMGRAFKEHENKLFDLTKMLPRAASVPIMCLMVAMYMGYKKIYLLGTEHDSFKTNEYHYAFMPKAMHGKDWSVKESGELKGLLYDALKSNTVLWEQYRSVKKIAVSNKVEIYNATLGGALDEFERVDLENLLVDLPTLAKS